MASLQTPIQRSITPAAVPLDDPNRAISEQIGRVAGTLEDIGFAQIKAQNADRLNKVQLDATKKLDDLRLDFQDDPDPGTAGSRFADRAAQIHDEAAGQLPDQDSRSSFAANFGHLAEAHRVEVSSDALRTLNENANANVLNSLETYTQQAAQARNPNERLAIITQASDTLNNAVTSRVMKAPRAAQLAKGFRQNLAELDMRRAIDTDPTAAVKAIRANQFPDADPLTAEREIERGEAEILAREREAKAALRDTRTDARSALSDLEEINRAGLPVSQQASTNVRSLIAAAGDRSLSDRYGRILRVSNFLTGLRGATPSQVQGVLDDLETKAANGADATLAAGVIATRQYAQSQASGLRDDPLTYAQGQVRAQIAPLSLSGNDAPEAWQQRVQQGDRVAAYYGTKPAYLTRQETDTLKGALAPTQSLASRLHLAQTLVQGLGPDKALTVFAAIAPNDPVVANAGALMAKGNHGAARDALLGQGLLHNAADGKQSDLRPTPAGRNAMALVGDLSVATGIAGEAGRGQILSTADAIYAARAPAMGLTGASIGNGDRRATELYARAVNEAAGAVYDSNGTQWGGVTHYNDVAVLAPAGVPADKFEDAVHGLSDRALTTHSVGGAPPMIGKDPLKAADLSRLFVMTVGDGLYALSTTDPRQSVTPIHDANGRLYKFSLLNAFDHPAKK